MGGAKVYQTRRFGAEGFRLAPGTASPRAAAPRGGGAGLPADLADYLDKVSSVSSLPVCAGFGIRAPEDVAAVGRHAAGAIVGSALVEVLERGEDPQPFLKSLLAE